ncbi:MAG: serine/threonine protein kinase [Chloroflexota bacterium]|nr:serine/threonine protein kinase [Chloroflexota bacterium]
MKLQDRYTIVRRLPSGGFGRTYEADDVLLDRKVAIKELFTDKCVRAEDGLHVNLTLDSFEEAWEAQIGYFLQEARDLARAKGDNIVDVYDHFEANGTAYMVMEYIDGEDLYLYLKNLGSSLEPRAALRHITSVAAAVHRLHKRAKLVHCDIKPNNIMITSADGSFEGEPILIDFGTVRRLDHNHQLEMAHQRAEGTPGFAPPELFAGAAVGPYTDVYSLAATLYYMLTRRVLTSDRQRDLMRVEERLRLLLTTALEPDPHRRTPDARTFAKNLEIIYDLKHVEEEITPQPESGPDIIGPTLPAKLWKFTPVPEREQEQVLASLSTAVRRQNLDKRQLELLLSTPSLAAAVLELDGGPTAVLRAVVALPSIARGDCAWTISHLREVAASGDIHALAQRLDDLVERAQVEASDRLKTDEISAASALVETVAAPLLGLNVSISWGLMPTILTKLANGRVDTAYSWPVRRFLLTKWIELSESGTDHALSESAMSLWLSMSWEELDSLLRSLEVQKHWKLRAIRRVLEEANRFGKRAATPQAMAVVQNHGTLFAQALADAAREERWEDVVVSYSKLVSWGYEGRIALLYDLLDAAPTNARYTESLLREARLDIDEQKVVLCNYGGRHLKRLLQGLDANTRPQLMMMARNFIRSLELKDCNCPQASTLMEALPQDLGAQLRTWCIIARFAERGILSRAAVQEMALALAELSGLSPAVKKRAVSQLLPILGQRVRDDATLQVVLDYAGQALVGSSEQLYASMFASAKVQYKASHDPQVLAPYLRLAMRQQPGKTEQSRIADLLKEMTPEELSKLNMEVATWPEVSRREWVAYLQSAVKQNPPHTPPGNKRGRGRRKRSDALMYFATLMLIVVILIVAYMVAEQLLLHPASR